MKKVYKTVRKLIVGTGGFSVLALGIILIPLPGPGILVCILGLIILSWEFTWAERHLDRAKSAREKLMSATKNSRDKNTPAPKS